MVFDSNLQWRIYGDGQRGDRLSPWAFFSTNFFHKLVELLSIYLLFITYYFLTNKNQ